MLPSKSWRLSENPLAGFKKPALAPEKIRI
jgi:hypothetical protein